VILDSELRLPGNSRLLTASRPTLIFCSEAIVNSRASRFKASHVSIYPVRKDGSGFLDLDVILGELWSIGYRSVMVEGGARVITNFLQAQVVDWLVLTIAPTLLGGLRIPITDPESGSWQPVGLDIKGSATYGNDWVIWGQPDWESQ
jgi:GTP cyclohydrolase II